MIASDRFPNSGYSRSQVHGFGSWHLSRQPTPGAETVPGVVSVIRAGPNGQGSEYIMHSQPVDSPASDQREVKGELAPYYPVRRGA
jgi:hypothetical protein